MANPHRFESKSKMKTSKILERNSLLTAVLDDLEYHEKIIQAMEHELKTLPSGSVQHRRVRGISRFYYNSPAEQNGKPSGLRYLRKNEQKLIRDLLRKKFIIQGLKVLRPNLKALEMLLKSYKVFDSDGFMKEICQNMSLGEQEIPLSLLKKENAETWENEQYEQSNLYLEQLEYVTQNGLRVRSKSESIIAGLLEVNQIPFRYEALLALDERSFYPDFTILNPQDKSIVYWEHFGMADNEEYEQSMNNKLRIYKNYGISQWDNLIVTFETKTNPFNVQKIQKLIKAFFIF